MSFPAGTTQANAVVSFPQASGTSRFLHFDFTDYDEFKRGLTILSVTLVQSVSPGTSASATLGTPTISSNGGIVQVEITLPAAVGGSVYTFTCSAAWSDGVTVIPVQGKIVAT